MTDIVDELSRAAADAARVRAKRGRDGLRRRALGAQPAQVVGLVLRSGMKLVAIGVVLGLAGAAGTARAIQTLLFQVRPIDPIVYAVVAAVFTIVATLACLVPSWRASRIDPLIALRAE
jgi:putative ABC transport system permease protein